MCSNITNDDHSFLHPTENYKISIFFYAAHMLKLIRNTFTSKEILSDSQGNAINWKFIIKLHQINKIIVFIQRIN